MKIKLTTTKTFYYLPQDADEVEKLKALGFGFVDAAQQQRVRGRFAEVTPKPENQTELRVSDHPTIRLYTTYGLRRFLKKLARAGLAYDVVLSFQGMRHPIELEIYNDYRE
jgi:hypothetical protein